MVATAKRISCRFEVCEHAILHAAHEHGRVRYSHFSHLFRTFGRGQMTFNGSFGKRPFCDERVRKPADFRELTDEMATQIDDMRVDVAVNAAAAEFFLQSPV